MLVCERLVLHLMSFRDDDRTALLSKPYTRRSLLTAVREALDS